MAFEGVLIFSFSPPYPLIRVERFVALDKLRGAGDLVEVLGHVDPVGLGVQGPSDLPVTRRLDEGAKANTVQRELAVLKAALNKAKSLVRGFTVPGSGKPRQRR